MPLKHRYVAKTASQGLGVAMSMATMGVVPRALGPVAYGNFTFLYEIYNQFLGLLDSGTSSAFFTKVSQRPEETALRAFYLRFVLLTIFVILAATTLVLVTPIRGWLFADQSVLLILLVCGYSLFNWVIGAFDRLMDAFALTVSGEKTRVGTKVLYTCGAVTLFATKSLTIYTFIGLQFGVALVLAIGWITSMRRAGISAFPSVTFQKGQFRGYFVEFSQYASPLIVFSIISGGANTFDRWLLQRYGGAEQQGYFGFAAYLTGMAFTLAAPMAPLMTRELSHAFGRQDRRLMAELLERYVPILYWAAGYFAVFICINSDVVTQVIGGGKYVSGVAALTVYSLYPLQQVYGQMVGGVFYATGSTKLYRNLGVFFALLGVPISLALILPLSHYGLGLGALGLALKIVGLGWIQVNVYLLATRKMIPVRVSQLAWEQLRLGAFLVGAAFVAKFATGFLTGKIFLRFLMSGMIYSAIIALLTPFLLKIDVRTRLLALAQRFGIFALLTK